MRHLRSATAVLALLAASAAWPADNITVKNSAGTDVIMKSKDAGSGVQLPQSSPSDALGVPFGYAAWGAAPTGNVPGVNAYVLALPALPTGANVIGSLTNISGTISLPTGAATSALQTSGNTSLTTLAGAVASARVNNNIAAIGGATTGLAAWGATPTGTVLGANVNCVAGCSASSGITSWAGGTLGTGAVQAFGATEATIGTGLVPSFNAHITNTNNNGAANSLNSSPVVIASDQSAVNVTPQAIATGGSSTAGAITSPTGAVVVKASAGTIYGVQLGNIGSVPAYLKIYNAVSATCGSGTPVKRLIIPAAATAANGAGSNVTFGPAGVAMGTGITYCVTTGIGDADATGVSVATVLINVDFK